MRRRAKKRKEKNVGGFRQEVVEILFDTLDLLFRPIVWVLKGIVGIFKMFD